MISGCGCNHMVAFCAAAGGVGYCCNGVHGFWVLAHEVGA